MKKKLIALVLLAGSSAFAESRFSIGVGIGAPVVASRPFYPGPGYTWVDGYYDPYGSWIDGYWAPPVAAFGFSSRYRSPFDYGFRRDFDRDDRRDFDRRDFDRDGRRDFGRAREFDRDHDGDRSRATGFGFRR
jgi:hypothetical protein